MRGVIEIVTGIFILVGIFLFLSKGDETVKIISTFSTNATSGIRTLQGR